MEQPVDQPTAGELIVRNGKRKGARLPLRHPLTLVGSGDGCDVRLSGEGVVPFHCAITLTADGPTLRAGFGGAVLVNGEARDDGTLVDGDEVRVGPCLFQFAGSPRPAESTPPVDSFPTQAAQIADLFDERQRQVADRDQQLADARAAFRNQRDAERDRLVTDREQVDRLKEEARAIHAEAVRERDEMKRQAVQRAEMAAQAEAESRKRLDAEQAAVAAERDRLTEEQARFAATRSEFHTTAAATQDRLRESWAALESQRKRAAAEWSRSNDYFAQQESALAARTAALITREKAASDSRSALVQETAALRREAAGLEERVQNTRLAVVELEAKRESHRAELRDALPIAEEKPTAPLIALDRKKDVDLATWSAELDSRELQTVRDRKSLAAFESALARDAASLEDHRQILVEQFTLLAAARLRWQETEQQTLAEMEDLARELRQREQELDVRERRLIRADSRRREDGYELWQLRLRLHAWQSRLTAYGSRWHTEREQHEADTARRAAALARREAEVESLFEKWEQAREQERGRLRAELELWADSRTQMERAAADYALRMQGMLGELLAHASRAMAAEQLVGESGQDPASDRVKRRLEVMRKRWEREFNRRVAEVAERQSALAAESARLEERHKELHRLLADVTEREAALNTRLARGDVGAVLGQSTAIAAANTGIPISDELAALREEVERMAAVLIEIDLPEPPDSELPWGGDEAEVAEPAAVLPFESLARAA